MALPGGVYPGDACVVTVDPNNADGWMEEYEIEVPEDAHPGCMLLVQLPEDGTKAKVKPAP